MADHFDQYSIYSKIEFHIELSKKMYAINQKGLHLIQEFKTKKYARKRGDIPIFNKPLAIIYTNLINILNYRVYTPRLYMTLKNYLDALLFSDNANKYTKFVIEDKEYDLTRLYYDQDCWIQNQEIQRYELDKGAELDITETMCLVCFLREYEDFLFLIEDYTKQECKEIYKTTCRIRYKLNAIWDIVTNNITSSMSPRKN